MEYFLINEWYSHWYATLILSLLTAVNVLIWCGVAFVVSVVYDIYRQVSAKWTAPKSQKTTPKQS